jgi:O-antigen/teichoic acid export membrane protein
MPLSWKLLFATALRGLNLLAKLLFTIVLARVLVIEDFGHWVLVVAIVTYGTFALGAELYNITLRTYISAGLAAALPRLSAQFCIFGIGYGITFVAACFYSAFGNSLAHVFAPIIALILIFEHISLEVHRLSFFSDHQVHANAILLIKSAGWMVPIGFVLVFSPSEATLGLVLRGWLVGAIAATLYGLCIYRDLFRKLRPSYLPQFSGKARLAFTALAPFLLTAVALRTPFLADRYLIKQYSGSEELAVYGYFATFGGGLQAIFDVLILARLTPRLLNLKQNPLLQWQMTKAYLRDASIFWIFSVAVLWIVLPQINAFAEKESFSDSLPLMLVILGGQLVFSLASILHYALYAMNRDRQLAEGAILYLLISLILFAALIPLFGNYGAAAALMMAATGLFFMRFRQLLSVMNGNTTA